MAWPSLFLLNNYSQSPSHLIERYSQSPSHLITRYSQSPSHLIKRYSNHLPISSNAINSHLPISSHATHNHLPISSKGILFSSWGLSLQDCRLVSLPVPSISTFTKTLSVHPTPVSLCHYSVSVSFEHTVTRSTASYSNDVTFVGIAGHKGARLGHF
jgi:hypothetical protein